MKIDPLKGRPPFPFETIAVAVSFSSHLENLLGEAKILAGLCGARLLLIHIGERTPGKEATLGEILNRLAIGAGGIAIIWRPGNPARELLPVCKENLVDLLILRAKPRERGLSYYLGSVVRSLSRTAKCSLLLLTNPQAQGTSLHKIVVNAVRHPKTIATAKTAIYLAGLAGGRELAFIVEADEQGVAMVTGYNCTEEQSSGARTGIPEEDRAHLQKLVQLCDSGNIDVTSEIVSGRPGYAIRQYAEACGADLLCINSPDARYGLIDRIFTHDMEFILENLPCNLLIVHSRGAGESDAR